MLPFRFFRCSSYHSQFIIQVFVCIASNYALYSDILLPRIRLLPLLPDAKEAAEIFAQLDAVQGGTAEVKRLRQVG